jgi:hypothetical protein
MQQHDPLTQKNQTELNLSTTRQNKPNIYESYITQKKLGKLTKQIGKRAPNSIIYISVLTS